MITLVLGALAEEPRPILGIGVGLRGDGDGAEFVASTRVRTSEGFVVEPGLLIQYGASTSDLDYRDDYGADDRRDTQRDVRVVPEIALRGKLARRGRVTGWLLARVSGSYRDVELEMATWPSDAESGAGDEVIVGTQRYLSFSGGTGFATELFLSREIALSADLGAEIVAAGWVWSVNGISSSTGTSTGSSTADSFSDYAGFSLGLEPYAQLAIHLYY